MLLHQFALALLAASPFVSGAITQTLLSTTVTSQLCATKQSTKSPTKAIPTSTKKITLPPNIIVVPSKSTPIRTVTPSPKTTTVTRTTSTIVTVTDRTITDVFSTTSTIFETSTISSTTTSTTTFSIETTTTVTTQVLVPTPAGFRSSQDTTGDQPYVGARMKRAQRANDSANNIFERGAPQGGMCKPSKQRYPVAVTCTDKIQVRYTKKIIAVAPTSTTTLKPRTVTATTTTTIKSTSTVVPSRVSTTSSFSTTTTVVTILPVVTEVSTTSTTETVTATSTISIYEGCASGSPNVFGPRIASGNYYNQYQEPDSDNYDIAYPNLPAGDSGVLCCNACFSTPGCKLSIYATTTGECNVLFDSAGTCDASAVLTATILTVAPNDPIRYFDTIISNGPCGGAWIDRTH